MKFKRFEERKLCWKIISLTLKMTQYKKYTHGKEPLIKECFSWTIYHVTCYHESGNHVNSQNNSGKLLAVYGDFKGSSVICL